VRNLEGVHVLAADQLNTYDVLCADDVVFTRAGLEAFVSGAQPVGGAVDVQVTTEVTTATTSEPTADEATADEAEKPAKKATAKKATAKKSTATEATEAEQAQEETK
jgi:large subunit ribosomal protein L4